MMHTPMQPLPGEKADAERSDSVIQFAAPVTPSYPNIIILLCENFTSPKFDDYDRKDISTILILWKFRSKLTDMDVMHLHSRLTYYYEVLFDLNKSENEASVDSSSQSHDGLSKDLASNTAPAPETSPSLQPTEQSNKNSFSNFKQKKVLRKKNYNLSKNKKKLLERVDAVQDTTTQKSSLFQTTHESNLHQPLQSSHVPHPGQRNEIPDTYQLPLEGTLEGQNLMTAFEKHIQTVSQQEYYYSQQQFQQQQHPVFHDVGDSRYVALEQPTNAFQSSFCEYNRSWNESEQCGACERERTDLTTFPSASTSVEQNVFGMMNPPHMLEATTAAAVEPPVEEPPTSPNNFDTGTIYSMDMDCSSDEDDPSFESPTENKEKTKYQREKERKMEVFKHFIPRMTGKLFRGRPKYEQICKGCEKSFDSKAFVLKKHLKECESGPAPVKTPRAPRGRGKKRGTGFVYNPVPGRGEKSAYGLFWPSSVRNASYADPTSATTAFQGSSSAALATQGPFNTALAVQGSSSAALAAHGTSSATLAEPLTAQGSSGVTPTAHSSSIDATTEQTVESTEESANKEKSDPKEGQNEDAELFKSGGIRGRYACSNCDFTTLNRRILFDHRVEKHSMGAFKCNRAGCNFSTPFKMELRFHTRQHTGAAVFVCDECDYRTIFQSSLTRHKLSHNGLKPYKCDICSAGFTQKHNLVEHTKKHTGEKTEKQFKCNLCHYSTREERMYQKHMKNHDGRKLYECEHCNFKSPFQKSYNQHMLKHTGEKPFKCHLCPAAYTQRTNLTKHLREHAGVRERPHKCEFCSYASDRRMDIVKHSKRHLKVKPFKCDLCYKDFLSRSSLIIHRKTHDKPNSRYTLKTKVNNSTTEENADQPSAETNDNESNEHNVSATEENVSATDENVSATDENNISAIEVPVP